VKQISLGPFGLGPHASPAMQRSPGSLFSGGLGTAGVRRAPGVADAVLAHAGSLGTQVPFRLPELQMPS